MKIEELISIPSDFEKTFDDGVFETQHQNSCGTIIMTWKNTNDQIIGRCKIDERGKGYGFKNFQDIIHFFLIKRYVPFKEKIAICSFSKESKKQ